MGSVSRRRTGASETPSSLSVKYLRVEYTQEISAAGRDATRDALIVKKQQRILRGFFGKIHEHKDTNYKVFNLKSCQDLVGSSNIDKLPEMYVLDLLLDEDLRTEAEQGRSALFSLKADNEGRSPIELAVKTRHTDIQQMRLEKPVVREYVQHLYMDRQMYVDATNAILVGAGIIASVTFLGCLDPPLEDSEENWLLPTARSILSHKSFNKGTGTNPQVFEVFLICYSMSLFFAVASALGGAGAVLPSSHAFVRKSSKSSR
ncbi:hypothetical protein AXG93_1200s1750 [Marchantia polymorpha subsp. ruderalis]|uniref:PGG domain-containing protein n=1 Tax=Marchantia polymorpha subsp. ruderalis TaxID=1480154 RepID=A0A176WL16_MARPO|nr:hypothetical protein AXG93_1200s1750 [Marchantia polymorpha subsp. ruderalis]